MVAGADDGFVAVVSERLTIGHYSNAGLIERCNAYFRSNGRAEQAVRPRRQRRDRWFSSWAVTSARVFVDAFNVGLAGHSLLLNLNCFPKRFPVLG